MKTDSTTEPKVRKIRDRDAAPAEKAVPAINPKVRTELLDFIRQREDARMKKNEANRDEGAAFKRIEALMQANGIKSVGGRVKIGDSFFDVSANYEAGQKKVVDLEALRRLVKKDVWQKCLVAQIGLVEQHAGKAILAEATSYVPTPETLSITSTKIGG